MDAGIQPTTMSQGQRPVQRGPKSISQRLPNTTAHPGQSQRSWFFVLKGHEVDRWKSFTGAEEMKLNSSWRLFVFPMTYSGLKCQQKCQWSNSRLWVNYWVPEFKNSSDALDLKWFKRIEQKGERRGNQTPSGILCESTKRLDWNLQSIYKEAVKSFIRLKGVGRETQEVRQERHCCSSRGRGKQHCNVGQNDHFLQSGGHSPLPSLVHGQIWVRVPPPPLTSSVKCHFHSRNLSVLPCKLEINSTHRVLWRSKWNNKCESPL